MNRRTMRNGLLALTICAAAILLPAHRVAALTCSPACQQCMVEEQQWEYACYIACAYGGFCPCTPAEVASRIAYCQSL